ncbi:transport system subunit 2 [Halovivax asiaticus JCM 14624]|uniref:Transport system subunit 2 n=1 Tax=Halovivax asiaticus JCM 14624 TaxID=1227490 RepID=M0BR12_9EURY|nr:magnesium transporter [Halovivax asiaticus]ELZ13446.1 transport system subunit 2 [Halovivax asiaticus JCM 14624]
MGADGELDTWSTRSIVRTMFPLLVVLSAIVLWAGLTLEEAEELLAEYGLLAVMVPTIIGTGGNLGAILSSRLTTRFHLGMTDLDVRDPDLWANVVAIVTLALTIFTLLGVGAFLVGLMIGSTLSLPVLLAISIGSGTAIAILVVVFSFAATYGSYRLGVDPDDTTIPIITSLIDVFGVVIFLAVASLVVGL